ncbi:hypothetical protein EVG20_g2050 [Dentipellis fragilis]|uniref:Uncharacterized protein n=1 Tax=Dentipellis fragilis TaxID=205917 RepID=A0A4Y9Z7W7_9AGAM|nr:hypothetical protein EVG20_g2050 [Dentipellis fragilis]
MASRIARRLLSTGSRVARQQAAPHPGAGHYFTPGGSSGSDRLWQIGSAAIFLPTLAYLLSPGSRASAHDAHKAPAHSAPETPAKAEQPAPAAAEVTETKAEAEVVTTDDEGTEVPAEEIKESNARAFATDAPQDASAAEVAETKFDSGKPGQTSESETSHEQSEKPQPEPKTGTVQSSGETGPTDLGDAREASTSGKQPKEAQ